MSYQNSKLISQHPETFFPIFQDEGTETQESAC